MMTAFSDNNIIYTEFRRFKNRELMIKYVDEITLLHENKDDAVMLQIDSKLNEIYIRIVKYKIWIKEPYFSLN